jgi:hypothetical protein
MVVNYSGGCLNSSIAIAAIVFRTTIRKEGEKSFIRYLPSYFFSSFFAAIIGSLFIKYVAFSALETPKE